MKLLFDKKLVTLDMMVHVLSLYDKTSYSRYALLDKPHNPFQYSDTSLNSNGVLDWIVVG